MRARVVHKEAGSMARPATSLLKQKMISSFVIFEGFVKPLFFTMSSTRALQFTSEPETFLAMMGVGVTGGAKGWLTGVFRVQKSSHSRKSRASFWPTTAPFVVRFEGSGQGMSREVCGVTFGGVALPQKGRVRG